MLTYSTCICRLRWESLRLSFTKIFGIRKLECLGYRGVVCMILRLAVLVEHRLVTDGLTD